MPQPRQQAQIALRFFVMARWVMLGLIALGWVLQLIGPTMFRQIVSWFPPQPEPIGTGVVVVALAVANVLTSRLVLARERATTAIAGAHLLLDAAALTALLALSGGVSNSFTTMYFVPMTLATQLSPRWTWAIGGACLLGFAGLFVLAPASGPPGHEEHFVGHIRGMWVAFGMSAAFMITFVHRIATSLSRQREELDRLKIAAQQDRQLAALGTLAAGAAHELGSPLGTIGMLVSDLQYMDAKEQAEAITTIKQEMARCKHILQQMSSPETRVASLGSAAEPWKLTGLEAELRAMGAEVKVKLSEAVRAGAATTQPAEVVLQVVRAVVSNALDACRAKPGSAGPVVEVEATGEQATIKVIDDGVGMPPAAVAAAFDPFFSTKAEGSGMGLGLFLARAHLRKLGGTIELQSEIGRGTTATVRFPLSDSLRGATGGRGAAGGA